MELGVIQQLVVSLGLGMLLGLQRERTEKSLAGIRTFPFIALLGTVCAQIGEKTGEWIIPAGLVSLAALVVMANLIKVREKKEPGMTSEIAILLVYMLGVVIVVGEMSTAVVLGGGMAMLLHFKKQLHGFANAVGEKDMHAIIQFVLISLVILPILPHENYGPYEVLNPFKIWLMVVLIVGISLSGYVAYKLLGANAGTLLGGAIGGMVSSTATTVSFARRAKTNEQLIHLGTLVVMIASCMSLVRVLVEIGVAAPSVAPALIPPLAAMLGVCILITGALFLFGKRGKVEIEEPSNPTEFKPALIFACLYAFILIAVAFAKDKFGDQGLYVVAIISGTTDMDAITLSTSQLAARGEVDNTVAWRSILMGCMANFVFKFGIVAALGPKELTIRVAIAFASALAGGAAILMLWP